jgi:hypothetical protein
VCDKSKLDWKEKRRARHLTTSYGITQNDYDVMYSQQEGCCKICGTEQDVLNVDHCHRTNKVRGLLCVRCNLGLGYFSDNIPTFKKVINYLEMDEYEDEYGREPYDIEKTIAQLKEAWECVPMKTLLELVTELLVEGMTPEEAGEALDEFIIQNR